jgi:hypothetical protein
MKSTRKAHSQKHGPLPMTGPIEPSCPATRPSLITNNELKKKKQKKKT